MKTTILIFLTAVSIAHANIIPIGQVTFTGDITLNHLYFTNPNTEPFGTLSNQTVLGSNGIFSPFVQTGDVLPGQTLFSSGNLPLFSLDGFDFATFILLVTGPDTGLFVRGFVDLTGNGYQPDPNNAISWEFTAPPFDFNKDVTGPISLTFNALHNTVPDTGSTLALMGLGMLGLFFFARRIRA